MTKGAPGHGVPQIGTGVADCNLDRTGCVDGISTRSTRGTGSDLIGALPKKSMSTAPMHINCNTVAGRSLQLSPSRMEAQEVLVRLKLNPVDDIYAFQQQ